MGEAPFTAGEVDLDALDLFLASDARNRSSASRSTWPPRSGTSPMGYSLRRVPAQHRTPVNADPSNNPASLSTERPEPSPRPLQEVRRLR